MRKVVYWEWVTREHCKHYVKTHVFLFGDNTIRQGYGGQAGQMRGEPNAIGIVTKRFPSNEINSFLYDRDYEEIIRYIDRDFLSIPDDVTVVIPKDGIGTGLARLDVTAPKIFKYILDKIEELENDGQ